MCSLHSSLDFRLLWQLRLWEKVTWGSMRPAYIDTLPDDVLATIFGLLGVNDRWHNMSGNDCYLAMADVLR